MGKPLILDLCREHKEDYVPAKTPTVLYIASAQYLAIEGQGEPGGEAFQSRVGALYAMAYTIKMTRKFAGKQDYKVCPLEAEWWGGRPGAGFARVPRDQWKWRLLIRTPDFVTPKDLDQARETLLAKGKDPQVQCVKLAKLDPGRCIQMLHVGPYDQIGVTAEEMRRFAIEHRLTTRGRHHEIYLSDPCRTAPDRLRTILRQPIR